MSQPPQTNGQTTAHPDDTPAKNRGLVQAYKLRDFSAALALALQADSQDEQGNLIIRRDEYGKPVDCAALTALVKAWAEATDRIRILRGRPLPGSKRPAPELPKRKAKSAPLSPTEEP